MVADLGSPGSIRTRAILEYIFTGMRPHIRKLSLNTRQLSANGLTATLAPASDRTKRIANTAVPADLTRQSKATVPVTHYFDLERICRECGRPFIFFAVEQKHWYETLRFPLEADAVRCPICRKQNQALGKARATYERLQKLKNRTETDTVRLTESLLTLVENSIFSFRQTEHARAFIKTLPNELRADFLKRIRQIEETTRRANNRPSRTSG